MSLYRTVDATKILQIYLCSPIQNRAGILTNHIKLSCLVDVFCSCTELILEAVGKCKTKNGSTLRKYVLQRDFKKQWDVFNQKGKMLGRGPVSEKW